MLCSVLLCFPVTIYPNAVFCLPLQQALISPALIPICLAASFIEIYSLIFAPPTKYCSTGFLVGGAKISEYISINEAAYCEGGEMTEQLDVAMDDEQDQSTDSGLCDDPDNDRLSDRAYCLLDCKRVFCTRNLNVHPVFP